MGAGGVLRPEPHTTLHAAVLLRLLLSGMWSLGSVLEILLFEALLKISEASSVCAKPASSPSHAQVRSMLPHLPHAVAALYPTCETEADCLWGRAVRLQGSTLLLVHGRGVWGSQKPHGGGSEVSS